ncbi:hypothetical protein K8I31_00890 [bacterium]|nr:hypothetical protein [bacterium]
MAITSNHVTGFVVGLGTAAFGYYLYKKNQPKVDEFLRKQGIQVPHSACKDYSSMTMEELVTEKENLEDFIAEREMASTEAEQPA